MSRTRFPKPGVRIRRLFAVLSVLLGTAVLGWALFFRQSTHDQGLSALKLAYKTERPIGLRISGFEYAPYSLTRGSKPSEVRSLDLERAQRFLLDAVFDNPRPSTLQALGQFYLTQREFTKASEQFARALEMEPQNARLHNDLGVALVEKSVAPATSAKAGEEVELFAIALEHFNQSLAIKRDLPEALFNRARLYQRMMIPQEARTDWNQFLKSNASSPWAEEVRRDLKALEDSRQQPTMTPEKLFQDLSSAYQANNEAQCWRIVNNYRDLIGSLAIRGLLDQRLLALKKGDWAESDRLMKILIFAGTVEKKITGDNFTSTLASFYQRNAQSVQSELVNARGLLNAGLQNLSAMKVETASGQFAEAKRLFTRIQDVAEASQADFLLARSYRRQDEAGARAEIYERLSRVCTKSGFQWLQLQILMAQAFVQSGVGNDSNMLEIARKGIRIATKSQDVNSLAKLMLLAGESNYNLGGYHQSLKYYQNGLELLHQSAGDAMTRWGIYMSIALPFNALGHHSTAIAYQQESLRIAHEIGNLKRIGLSHVNLGLTYSFQRNYEEAIKHAEQAFQIAQSAPVGVSRTELLALASVRLGQMHNQTGRFEKASQAFNVAIGLYHGTDSQEAFQYIAHKGRLISALAQGNAPSAEEEITSVLNLFESYRGKIREEDDRNIFFDVEQPIYDIAIDFWYSQKKDPLKAFELTERSRARSLLDQVGAELQQSMRSKTPATTRPPTSPPLSFSQIQAQTPADVQIVQYAVLKNRLLIWALSQNKPLICLEQKISDAQLSKEVADYLRFVAAPPSQTNQAAASQTAQRLFTILIAPVAPLLETGKQLCLIPDKILNQLPFSALISPATGRYLIEDYSMVFSPSATMFLVCTALAKEKENVKEESLLSVGDPAFDRQAFSLPYLVAAREEAQTVASYYKQSLILLGEQATQQQFESKIEHFNILHLALHCVVDGRSPMRSQFLLAKAPAPNQSADAGESSLYAHEIYRLPLSGLRVVVLAACRSGVERYYGGEGMVGISRPFIAKGVPMVIASLWEVDADATKTLMIGFHRNRKLGRAFTSEALRQSQLDLLRGSDPVYKHPYYWAGFESIGGYTKF